MVRDAEATKRRLLEAALAEFGARGLAGARVDRIAAEADSNKAQIYHYFGSKDGLFDAVFDAIVERTLNDVPIDTSDLPEYAAKLFDGTVTHPDIQRLATWHRLERGTHLVPTITVSYTHKLAALRAAQKAGSLTTAWSAEEILVMIMSISSMWSTLGPELDKKVAGISRQRRRNAVKEAVGELLAKD